MRSRATVGTSVMALLTHVAPHPDALVSLLCDRLVESPGDPFAPELVSVPSRGIERWLTQRIASGLAERGAGDGICANIEFPTPRDLVHRVLSTSPLLAASVRAWEGPDLLASILGIIDSNIDEPWMCVIARFLQGDAPPTNRMEAASKIARLFDRYARRRPEMIRRWCAGENLGPDLGPLTSDAEWQPMLWRAVRESVGAPSVPEVLTRALEEIRSGDVEINLPDRISVYGLTSTDPLDLEVLAAVASTRNVYLYILYPSPELWRSADHLITGPSPRSLDPIGRLPAHPLLGAWGRPSRELQSVLSVHGASAEPASSQLSAHTLLERLQVDIRANRSPERDPELERAVAGGTDRSIQIHTCHGARRQAEVMRDAVLHVLSSNPDLEPRDVVIMTPDLATFAPLLEAAFPAGGTRLPDVRLRIADRAPAATNPLVLFADTLLEMVASRFEANRVRELVTRPAIRQKFGFDADTAGEIINLIDDAAIAWGLDRGDRIAWNSGDTVDRTWRRGLDRILAGVFLADNPVRTIGDVAPLDGVEGQDAVPAGLLAAILDRLGVIREEMSSSRPMSEWGIVIARAVRVLGAPAWGEEWQLDQLERLLAETFRSEALISCAEARLAMSSWTEDRPSPLHFRTGDITVCTLVPMRSVPYRVVCLLGMDDARFPRRDRSDGDDLLTDHEMVGDTDRGSADRQLLLDALMAAGDHLIVTYSGRDELTNAELPPAVPISELRDTVRRMVGDKASKRIETDHPLQSFNHLNFEPDRLGVRGSWGFDPDQLAGARALEERTIEVSPISWPEPSGFPDPIRLRDLIAFLQNPARHFVRSRLGFSIPERGEIADDSLPTELSPLAHWQVTDRILSGLVAGYDLESLIAHERGMDALPPGGLGIGDVTRAAEVASALWSAARELDYDPSRHLPRAGRVPVGEHLIEGTVVADFEKSHLMVVTPSRIKAKHRIDTFVRLCFLSALEPDLAWRAHLLGRRQSGAGHVRVEIGPLDGDRQATAIEQLTNIVAIFLDGQEQPLPLPCETAYAWVRGGYGDIDKARRSARSAFSDGDYCESRDPEWRLLFPHLTTLEDLEREGFSQRCTRLWGQILVKSREVNL